MKQDLERIKHLKELFEQLKTEHKDVFELTVGDEPVKDEKDTRLYGYFRKPTFNEFRMIYPLIVKGDDLSADKRLVETCWLGGDPEMIDIDNNLDVFLSMKSELSQLIEIKSASLKKK